MNFSGNEFLRKDRTSSFLAYGEAGKHVLESQANFSEVDELLSSHDVSNFIPIGLQVFPPSHLHRTQLHVDQPQRDKPLKTPFGSSEKS